MPQQTKSYVQRFLHTSFADKLQLFGFMVGIVALFFVYLQLLENTNTNKVSIRGQLYQNEASLIADEVSDDKQPLTTIWTLVPPAVRDQEFATALIRLVSDDPTAQKAKTAEELYFSMFGLPTFDDPKRREETNQLRRFFNHMMSILNHVQNAHDYWKDGVLSDREWLTWKNYIREMNAHPILIAVIWQAHRHRYFSRAFGTYLQQELCADSVPPGDADPESYERGKSFVSFFYPDMLKKEWLDALPD